MNTKPYVKSSPYFRIVIEALHKLPAARVGGFCLSEFSQITGLNVTHNMRRCFNFLVQQGVLNVAWDYDLVAKRFCYRYAFTEAYLQILSEVESK